MSPEQARGQAVDKRTDIWAFGCVLYEMLTGRPAFPGETVSDTIAAILEHEPDWDDAAGGGAGVGSYADPSMPRERSPEAHRGHLDRAVRPRRPHEWAADHIDGRATATAVAPHGDTLCHVARRRRDGRHRCLVRHARHRPAPRVSRLLITPPSAAALTVSGMFRDLALTPDGTRLVYVGANGTALFVRALDQLDATPLTGLGAAFGPFVSPDGQWIGFFDGAATALKKVAITGGPAVTLGRPDGTPRGASWGADGTIIFATTMSSPSDDGPAAHRRRGRRADRADAAEPGGRRSRPFWPEILPGGQAVLFTITATSGGLDQAQVAVLDLRTGTQTVLIRGGSDAHYVSSGHLVYAAAGTLRAVAFDLARLAVVGTSVAVLPTCRRPRPAPRAWRWRPMGRWSTSRAAWSTGATQQPGVGGPAGPGDADARTAAFVCLSAALAGRHAPRVLHHRSGDRHLALGSGPRDAHARHFDPGFDIYPVWTPDGRQLFFSSERAGARNLFAQAADGTGAVTRLTESPNAQYPTSVSPDGTRLVFTEIAPTTGEDVHAAAAGRHACGDAARADAVQRAQRRGVARWPMARLRGERLGAIRRSTCGRFRTSRAATGRCRRTAARGRCGRGTVKSCSI